jgi:3-oxoacyl-[acyl-carrier-protein] synthase II
MTTSCSRSRRSKEAVADAGLDGAYDPARVGIVYGSAIGGIKTIPAARHSARPRSPTALAALAPELSGRLRQWALAIALGYRGPNYATVSACATGSHAVGEGPS